MSRFFVAWAGLAIIAVVVSFVVTLVAFRHVDLTFTQFAVLLVAPAAQAAVLVWPAGLVAQLQAAARSALRHRLAPPVLGLDAVLGLAGIVWWASTVLGFGAAVTIQPTWIAVKAIAAVFCVVSAKGVTVTSRVALGLVLLVVAAHAQFGVLEWLYAALDRRAMVVPEVFLRIGWFGGLFAAAVITVIRVSRTLNASARTWCSMALACSVPGVLLVVLSMFNNPGVLPPWRGLALLCASAAVTALLLGVLTTTPAEDDRP